MINHIFNLSKQFFNTMICCFSGILIHNIPTILDQFIEIAKVINPILESISKFLSILAFLLAIIIAQKSLREAKKEKAVKSIKHADDIDDIEEKRDQE